ncbi:hypothetical protein [Achromobacter phage Motura]|uniref:Uncharacterized protein n=1 Tax=Achromobacter phage Motura TaxID=2591403 RepID=A0A514CSZ5_9CAUD|nr:hypothetical protein H1O15_gp195 [Achromobacter phage Motura]QDH83593.1 hypothetical protein [Achromobacter phage Motura]
MQNLLRSLLIQKSRKNSKSLWFLVQLLVGAKMTPNLEALRTNHRVTDKNLKSTLNGMTEDIARGEVKLKKPVELRPGYTLALFSETRFGYAYAVIDGAKQVVARFELEKTMNKDVWTPHVLIAKTEQGKGLAYSIYAYFLEKGMVFMAGETQSQGASGLWAKLGQKYPQFIVHHAMNGDLTYLGESVDPKVMKKDETRIIMLGKGQTMQKVAKKTKMKMRASTMEARTFTNKSDVKRAAEELMKKLVTSINDYSLNSIDLTLRSNSDIEDVLSDFIGLGFKPFKPAAWEIDSKMRRARFLAIGERMPILVKENSNGWGTTVILLGEVLPKFRDLLFAFRNLIDGEPCLSISTMVPSVQGLQMEFSIKGQVSAAVFTAPKDSVVGILRDQGFHPAAGNMLISKKLGLYVSYSGNSVTAMDSRY